MPPFVALIICTVFVFFLLRLDHKQSPNVSLALWIPTIWILIIASKPLATWFGTGGSSMEEGSPLDRMFFIVIGCIGLIILAKRHLKIGLTIRENLWLIACLIYMLVSISWSELQFVSLKRWSRELIAVIMVLTVASEKDPRQSLCSIFRRIIYILIPYSLLLIKYYPHFGIDYAWDGDQMWRGVSLHKNSLCRLCLFAIFFLIWTFIRRQKENIIAWYQKYVEVFLLVLAIWLILGPYHSLTNSATSIASLAVGLITFVGLIWMKKIGRLIGLNTLMLMTVVIIVYGIITPFIGRLSVVDVSGMLGRNQTLTGRTEIWAILVPYALERPILGYGYGGFWTDAIRQLTSSHAHNGYLDIILNLGFVGLFLFSMVFISCCRKAHEAMASDFDWGIFSFCYLTILMVHNIAESSATSFDSFNPAVLLLLILTTAASVTDKVILNGNQNLSV